MIRVYENDRRIKLFGSENQVGAAEELIERFFPDIANTTEQDARIELQSLLDTEPLNLSILFEGNSVYGSVVITDAVKKVKKEGMKTMSNALYKFLHLVCGSIAHNDKHGWIAEYPTIEHLRGFFKKNEFGQRVLDYIPMWRQDAREIVLQIEDILAVSVI